ncbi:MAG: peptide ABC transporter substrate-binding protein [Chloroflexota bacterium]
MHLRDRAIIGLLSLILVGLTGAVVAPSLSPSGPEASPDASPIVIRPYIEGIVGTAVSVSPFSAQSVAEREIEALLFRGLVRLGPDDTLVGDLAERWTVDPSGAAWTFYLRPGLTWQDGEPITAEDVLFTVGALSDPAYTGPGASSWREVTATASDPLTVTLTLATPLGGFLQAATQGIAPAHLLSGVAPADLAADPFGRKPVGSGAFRLAAMDDQRALLVPYVAELVSGGLGGPNDSAPPPTDSLATATPGAPRSVPLPYLDGIEFRFFGDVEALTSAWGLGEIDGAAGLPADVAKRLAGQGSARILRYPSTTLFAVTLNLRPSHPEFRSAAVRKALLQAIDRDAIVRDVLGGLATRAEGLIPESSWAFDPAANEAIPYDPEAAQAALLAAGWKRADGGGWVAKGATEPLTVEILSPQADANPAAYAIAGAVASGWQAIGLTVAHTALAGAELVGDRLQTGSFDAAVIGTTIGLDPDLYPLLASTQATSRGSNYSGLQDSSLDPLLIKARAPGTDEERTAAYAALQVKLTAGQYVLPVAFGDVVVVARETLTGPDSRPVGAPGDRFWDVLTWRLAEGR